MSGTDGFILASWINNNRDLPKAVILDFGTDRQEMADAASRSRPSTWRSPSQATAGRSTKALGERLQSV
jgi:hypothetical protein